MHVTGEQSFSTAQRHQASYIIQHHYLLSPFDFTVDAFVIAMVFIALIGTV